MNKNNDVGQLLPKTFKTNNRTEYNCRMLPTPFNLFARSFLPYFFYNKSNDKYNEDKNKCNYIKNWSSKRDIRKSLFSNR